MKLLVPFALAIALGIVGPFVAHLLRRRRPEEREFPPARLVATAPPVARRRAHLEDRALFALRALAIALLAFLAASPLIRCHRLELGRREGASMAVSIVLDDSLSMSAELPASERRGGAKTRWQLAITSARDLASGLRSGDTVSLVLAGSPARIALPPTADPAALVAAIDQIDRESRATPSDRGTALQPAIALATAALAEAPQLDRRVVVLSDLADGHADDAPIEAPNDARIELSAPVAALHAQPPAGAGDCAVLSASLDARDEGDRVRVRYACSGATAKSIALVRVDASRANVGQIDLSPDGAGDAAPIEVSVAFDASEKQRPHGPVDGHPTISARIFSTGDAITRDDEAPVLGAPTAPIVTIVVGEGGANDDVVATGGNVVERAIRALEPDVALRTLPVVPDRDADLAPIAGLILDDPAALMPDARAAITRWLESGGVALITLGPHAGVPPLGASFEPLLMHPVRWERVAGALSIDPDVSGPFADEGAPTDLAPNGRARIDAQDLATLGVMADFSDHAPLLRRVERGVGEAWLSTLPFSPGISDLPLRPAFLALLDRFLARVRDREAALRIAPGARWSARTGESIAAVPIDDRGRVETDRPLTVDVDRGAPSVRPTAIGAFRVTTTDGAANVRVDVRAVAAVATETKLAPHALRETSLSAGGAAALTPAIDATPQIAWLLIAFGALEIAVRLRRLRAPRPEVDAETA